MVLLCLSDIHGEGAGIHDVLASSPEIDAILISGDVTHLGGYREAEKVLEPAIASGKKIFAVPGNMDGEGVRRFMGDRGIDLHGRGIVEGRFGLMGLGGSNRSPFGTPFELSDESARSLLARGYEDIRDAARKILLSHAPPRGTKLDRSFTGLHVGSTEVRDFLLSHPIDLCVCGHIHEGAGEDFLKVAPDLKKDQKGPQEQIRGVRCVNVGPFKSGRYAIITVTDTETMITWRKR